MAGQFKVRSKTGLQSIQYEMPKYPWIKGEVFKDTWASNQGSLFAELGVIHFPAFPEHFLLFQVQLQQRPYTIFQPLFY